MSGEKEHGWVAITRYLVDETPLGMLVPVIVVFGFMAIVMLVPVGLTSAVRALKTGSFFTGQHCIDLKEVGGKVYKIDQCQNTIEPFEPSAAKK